MSILLAIWKGILGFFKAVPLWVWLVVAVLIGVYVYGERKYDAGQANVQAEWDASVERGRVLVEEIKKKRVIVNTVIETKIEYRDRVITERGKDRVKIQEVFVPIDSGMLDGGFRLFYNAAVTDTIPNPAEIPDAAPVPVTDVAANVNTNYELCHKAYARVELFQEWANKMCATNPDGCPDAR